MGEDPKPCHMWLDLNMLENADEEWHPLPVIECDLEEGHEGKHVPLVTEQPQEDVS